jgi:uncharacterized protein YdaU (DUF1376 family)
MSLPYFPMFPTDFEAKTSHLTLAEDGAYNRLLRLAWMTPGCSIPADRTWVYRRMRALTEADQAIVESVIAEFFKETKGRLFNARLTQEWLSANEAHERRKNAGSKGGKAKALKTNEIAPSNATPMLKQPEPEPEPELEEERDKSLSVERPSAPSDRFEEAWKLYQSAPKRAKQTKTEARKQWPKAVKLAGGSDVLLKAIGLAIEAQTAVKSRKDFVASLPDMHRWLKRQEWADLLAASEAAAAPPVEIADDQWRRLLMTWHETQSWPAYAGPQPGHEGCGVPEPILERYRTWVTEQSKIGAAA